MSSYAERISQLSVGEFLEVSREEFRASIEDPMDRVAYVPLARRLAAQTGCSVEVHEESMVFRKKPPRS